VPRVVCGCRAANQFAQPLGITGFHAAELGSPLVERGRTEAFSAAQVRYVHAGVCLLDEPDDLFVRVPALAYRASFVLRGLLSIALVRIADSRSQRINK
jgi:hypothetical protein